MKRVVFWLSVLLLFGCSAGLSAATKGQQFLGPKEPVISGKLKLEVQTTKGVSQSWNTLKAYSAGRNIGKYGYSSFGGAVLLDEPKPKLVIWDYYQAEGEAHLDQHRYVVLVYEWNEARGKLSAAFYYKTANRYVCYEAGRKPFDEFLKYRKSAQSLIGLRRQKLAGKDLEEIRRSMLKNNPAMSVVKHAYVLGPWALVVKAAKGQDDMRETDIWEKTPKGWRYVCGGSDDFSTDRETPAKNGIPWFCWEKLTNQFWQ